MALLLLIQALRTKWQANKNIKYMSSKNYQALTEDYRNKSDFCSTHTGVTKPGIRSSATLPERDEIKGTENGSSPVVTEKHKTVIRM